MMFEMKWWHMLLGATWTAFMIATVVITLLFVYEVRDGSWDQTKLDYVEVANWIYAGVIALGVISMTMGTISGWTFMTIDTAEEITDDTVSLGTRVVSPRRRSRKADAYE